MARKVFICVATVALFVVSALANQPIGQDLEAIGSKERSKTNWQPQVRFARSANKTDHKPHHGLLHNHMSRKVFDRACAAAKDTIAEIMNCLSANPELIKSINPFVAMSCYSKAFGSEFHEKDLTQHKELICKNRDKFEQMTTCILTKATESLNPNQMDKFVEALVDVGLCVINALDG